MQLFVQKPCCVPLQFQLESLWYMFLQYTVFLHGENHSRRPAVSIYLLNSVILQLSQLFMQNPWRVPFQFQLKRIWHMFLQYTVFFMVKMVVGGLLYLFIKFGHIATFAIIYAKSVMCTLPIPVETYFAYVSAIHSIFFMVKIVVGSLR